MYQKELEKKLEPTNNLETEGKGNEKDLKIYPNTQTHGTDKKCSQ